MANLWRSGCSAPRSREKPMRPRKSRGALKVRSRVRPRSRLQPSWLISIGGRRKEGIAVGSSLNPDSDDLFAVNSTIAANRCYNSEIRSPKCNEHEVGSVLYGTTYWDGV